LRRYLDEKGSKLDHDAKLVKTSVVGYDGVCIGDMGHIGFLVYRYFSFTMFKTTLVMENSTSGNGTPSPSPWIENFSSLFPTKSCRSFSSHPLPYTGN
jgi:hypothetical protein